MLVLSVTAGPDTPLPFGHFEAPNNGGGAAAAHRPHEGRMFGMLKRGRFSGRRRTVMLPDISLALIKKIKVWCGGAGRGGRGEGGGGASEVISCVLRGVLFLRRCVVFAWSWGRFFIYPVPVSSIAFFGTPALLLCLSVSLSLCLFLFPSPNPPPSYFPCISVYRRILLVPR